MYCKLVSFTSYAGKKNIGQSFPAIACPLFRLKSEEKMRFLQLVLKITPVVKKGSARYYAWPEALA
ncbi:TPA: hypothetical protein ROX88_002885 [Bacillus pseudomycoides]|nr:hypothetical protein [Bacillus pseudomycoides]